MRSTSVLGTDDGLRLELGRDTSIIGEVMEIGKAVDYLVYEVQMSGAELIAFMRRFHLDPALEKDVKPENNYKVTSFDW